MIHKSAVQVAFKNCRDLQLKFLLINYLLRNFKILQIKLLYWLCIRLAQLAIKLYRKKSHNLKSAFLKN
ncbi:hypothetical protein BpHYR1_032552 [Brachionus plicatilis]|uniref:Uncharacterized protein n=1 Tax=Brachionus plicatilis TaxID=10195 RepID=A0A3M7PN40_BRAPC|nr:hypothetical protein BpHYR1_032552 [Brachionus plicatilis]